MIDCSNQGVVDSLYRRLGRPAMSKVSRVVGRLDVAQEIVQECFLKLWRRKIKFESEKSAYLWIYKTCHNQAVDYLRCATTRREGSEELIEGVADGNWAGVVDGAVNRDLVVKALKTIPKQDARILVFLVVDGMTQTEVAAVMGISRKTVSRALTRIEGRFRSQEAPPCLRKIPVH